ncbi:MAG: cyclopropane fatty acyl phospholipid synthase [Candidatus Saccharimonadales bacterium]
MDTSETRVKQLFKLANIKVGGSNPQDIVVHDKRFYTKVLRYRELGLGESYMDGWWDCKAIDQLITNLLGVNIRSLVKISPSLLLAALPGIFKTQSVTGAKKNAEHHYNIGNDLYQRMLGERMIYSCAYWKGAKTLDQAQENKLDLICRKLELKKGMKLLDIGCGWGGFAKYAASKYGVNVTGITPAGEQIKLAKEATKGLSVKILQKDYREITGKFDRITSIGMLEHVGPKNYENFFAICNQLLTDDGMMLHHTIASNKASKYINPWISKYIFPGGVLPSLGQISDAVADRWIIEDVQNFGPDYDKTLMAWHKNFTTHYKELKGNYDERFYRMWKFYLLICAGGFRSRHLQLLQLVMRKVRPSNTYIAAR